MDEENKEVDWLTKAFCEGVKDYYENTVEITKTVRIPKGKYCDACSFVKTDYFPQICPNGDFVHGGIVWCAIYGDRLKLDKNSLCGFLPYIRPSYYKCDKCLKDTMNEENK